jgi:Flp pilus assembly protein TadD
MSIVQRSGRNLLLAICLGVPLLYSLFAGEGRAWLVQVAGNLHYLPIQFSHDPTSQRENLSKAEALAAIRRGAHIDAYRAVQLALAPVRDCPHPDFERLHLVAPLPEHRQLQLAKWVEESSIVPECLSENGIDRAVAYFEWLNGASEGTVTHLSALPRLLAGDLIERAYRRYEVGLTQSGYADWTRARGVLAALSQDTFGELAERLAAGARSAQQEYLRRDLAKAASNQHLLREISLLLAQSYNESSRHLEAEELLAALLDDVSGDTRVWQQYGQSLLGQRRFPEAEEALRKAVSLAPSDSGALNRLGVLYMVWGQPDDAEAIFRRALETSTGKRSYWLWEHLGDVLAAQGEREDAAEAYRHAIERAPDELEASARAKLEYLKR